MIDHRELLVVGHEGIPPEGKRLEVARAVVGQQAERLLLDVGEELVGPEVLGEGVVERGLRLEGRLLLHELRGAREVFFEALDDGFEAHRSRRGVGVFLLQRLPLRLQPLRLVFGLAVVTRLRGRGRESPPVALGEGGQVSLRGLEAVFRGPAA